MCQVCKIRKETNRLMLTIVDDLSRIELKMLIGKEIEANAIKEEIQHKITKVFELQSTIPHAAGDMDILDCVVKSVLKGITRDAKPRQG